MFLSAGCCRGRFLSSDPGRKLRIRHGFGSTERPGPRAPGSVDLPWVVGYHRGLDPIHPSVRKAVIVAQPVSRKIVITVALLVAGFALLFSVGLKGSLVYYLTVSEFKDPARRSDLGDNFRVNGIVKAGTIQRHEGAPGARFVLTDGKQDLPVAYDKEVPDTFVDGAEAVVEG